MRRGTPWVRARVAAALAGAAPVGGAEKRAPGQCPAGVPLPTPTCNEPRTTHLFPHPPPITPRQLDLLAAELAAARLANERAQEQADAYQLMLGYKEDMMAALELGGQVGSS